MVPESPLGLTLVRSRGGELGGNPIYLACFFPDSNQGVINWKSLAEEVGVGVGQEGGRSAGSLY